MTILSRLRRHQVLLWAASVLMLWASQPPWCLWPLGLVAVVPLLLVVCDGTAKRNPPDDHRFGKTQWLVFWGLSTAYYLVSLEGIRHAHPVMYLGWFALSAYLALYHLGFVAIMRELIHWSSSASRTSWLIAAPLVWMSMELVRNYLLTGISVLMIGHTMAGVPIMIQVADLLGSYGVSVVVVAFNVAVALWCLRRVPFARSPPSRVIWAGTLVAATLLILTLGYGGYRIAASDQRSRQDKREPLATFALLQRDETIEFQHDYERELELFDRYCDQAVQAVRDSTRPIDAVVWPESMFTGAVPWQAVEDEFEVPDEAEISRREFLQRVRDSQAYWENRNRYLSQKLTAVRPDTPPPVHFAGCGVVQYGRQPKAYSGLVQVGRDGRLEHWYGKTHLVMFGEYVPLVKSIPWVNQFVPPGLGLALGDGPKRMRVGNTVVSPNICIETAVERVAVNQMTMPQSTTAGTDQNDGPADVIVTVTNDGWFDDSSLIDHHLRCVQMVAVGCRKPILSAANNGPTAWVDHCGRVIERLPQGTNGAVIATPHRAGITSLYVIIGDWPARVVTLIVLAVWLRTRLARLSLDRNRSARRRSARSTHPEQPALSAHTEEKKLGDRGLAVTS